GFSLNSSSGRLGVGSQIGPYKLLEPIGEGGMGLFYLAQQSEPVRRKVALKIIKPGMDSKQVIARFEAERQALAMMDHPNIAKVLDAGTTETGLPYFVMELVRGIPMMDYCDQAKMPTRRRLELFRDACSAIQHAHNKGVIHRDIKPSNVLLTEQDGEPLVKVIDFGIAKALTDNLTDKTMFTGMFQMMGTPLYMSPEQASLSNVDVDTRSDVYSLGVMLYELLSGTLPIDRDAVKELSFDELRKRICETEPPRPSKRLSTLNEDARETLVERRGGNKQKVHRLIANELDWIVMKTLEKDRNRRYQSARELSEDIGRFLVGDAVEACPPSAKYRILKYFKRNRGPVLATSAVVLALCAGTALSLWQAAQATTAKVEAEASARFAQTKADESKAILEFFVTDVLKSAMPSRALESEVTVKEMLVEAEAKMSSSFGDRPLVKAAIQEAIARTYYSLDDWKSAERNSSKAFEARSRILGQKDGDTIESMITHARILIKLNRVGEARKLFDSAYDLALQTHGESDIETFRAMFGIASCYFAESNYEDALEQLEKILDVAANPLTNSNIPYKFSVRNAKTISLKGLNRDEEALELQEALCSEASQLLDDNHPELMRYRSVLAGIYERKEDFSSAAQVYETLIEGRTKVYGVKSRKTLLSRRDLANLHVEMKEYSEAKKELEELLPLFIAGIGEFDSETSLYYLYLGRTCRELDELEASEEYLAKALKIAAQTKGMTHSNTLLIKAEFAEVVASRGDVDRALTLINELIEQSTQVRGADHPTTLNSINKAASIYAIAGRTSEAIDSRRKMYRVCVESRGHSDAYTVKCAKLLLNTLLDFDQGGDAFELCKEMLKREHGLPDAERYVFESNAALALVKQELIPDSVPYYEDAWKTAQEVFGECGLSTLRQQSNLGFALATTGEFDRGVELLRAVANSGCGHKMVEDNAKYNLTTVLANRCQAIGLEVDASSDARDKAIEMGKQAVALASVRKSELGKVHVVGKSPASREAWARRRLAVGFLGAREFSAAALEIEKADEIQGSVQPGYSFIKAAALCRLGRTDQSEVAYSEARSWVDAQEVVPDTVIQFREVADRAMRETNASFGASEKRN
ncbi:MAG TPA: hypothetical protein DDW52_26100, partial [Planctomycetaceae bacterium]|nr:hypothetical protein [Planctomycetaceae bacterium]